MIFSEGSTVNPAAESEKGSHEFSGIAASPGIAIGKAHIYSSTDYWIEERDIAPGEIDAEKARFAAAVEKVIHDIKELKYKIQTRVGEKHAKIFEPHIMLLQDPELIKETNDLIETGKSAEFAFFRTTRKIIKAYKHANDDYLRERIADIQDILRRVYAKLVGKEYMHLASVEEPVIVIASNLTPSDTSNMHAGKIKAFVTDFGGITSHVTILARALQIPAVVGTKNASKTVRSGDIVIVDGENGMVYINPTVNTIEKFRKEQKQILINRQALADLKELPAVTTDGVRIGLYANIEFFEEVSAVLENGAEGVGLYRSEFLYLLSDKAPEEDEQFTAYFKVAEKLAPDPVVIRTFDLGGDKISHIIPTEPEQNPYLGWRAIRLSLSLRELFKVQLRAIVRASSLRNVKILFPMISSVDELDEALAVLDEAKKEIKSEGHDFNEDIPVGIMIEVPSAVMIAEHLAKKVDFFSIGTNDLIQYSVAVDRANDRIANLFDPFHPGIIKLIAMTVEAAHNAGIPVAVCGEMGGNPSAAILFTGLGIDELSMIPAYIPPIKRIIRLIRKEYAREIAEKVLKLETGTQVRELIAREIEKLNLTSL
ncbi:phosphoenolpyruvate--protein phosphotransferase [bacterium]|nr:phosphoenolpyruvate--protein phosphotransferase [bacterium]